MDKYYLVIGPKRYCDTPEGQWWIVNSMWARECIVAEAEVQDATRKGVLYKIIYKPPGAPGSKNLRIPSDWVTQIPCFKYIEEDPMEKWEMVKNENGVLEVVRK